MKFLTTFVVSFLLSTSVLASGKEYVIVNPNTAGSSADLSARVLAEAYKRRTGNTLILQNIGGGNQVPGAVHFKQLTSPGIMINTTGLLVFNPKMMKDLPYQDSDFDHVSAISLTPAVWVVRADSQYRDIKQLVQTLHNSNKPFVAYSNNFELANLRMVSQKYKWNSDKPKARVTEVKYKGPSEVLLGLLGGDVEVAVVTLLPATVEHVKSGQLRILGSTAKTDLTVNGQRVPPVEQLIQVEQFLGGAFLSLSPRFDPQEAKQLKKDLIESLKDPMVIESLNARNQYIMEFGERPMVEFINNYRKKIATLDLNSGQQ